MKSLDCNQIKLYINLEIIGEEDKYKKNYIYFLKILKQFCEKDQMNSLDCNQIKIFINLEIIGEEDKYKKKKIILIFLKF